MKGLRKYIQPFAPDQSGASAVLYKLGGIIVICDAGGCAGNICGFDEPRWSKEKSAIFSAGLRDMDAILGRDDKLVSKLYDVSQKIEAKFAAVIGTPVPSVIATDYKAIKRMAEKKLNIPIITIETTGMDLYDVGAEKAYLEIFSTFAKDGLCIDEKSVGVIGAIPLDMTSFYDADRIKGYLKGKGFDNVYCYGMDADLKEVEKAGTAKKNIVVAPSGLKAAKYLRERFKTPYEVCYPVEFDVIKNEEGNFKNFYNKNILIVHQQVIANSIRDKINKITNTRVTVASWFMLKEEFREEQDIFLKEEDQFIKLVRQGNFDVIIGDEAFKRAVPDFKGEYIKLPHFAVSGRM
ncbi:nitrogenase molybdenum-iron protein [Clostridium fermenticellae]|uniref:Nitrogenase molybdenum-iron protein n=1 Tax=Clostridium fermenticellae TaxID=2068654 RepID=A0A386H1W1_9CLOT|nr:nitrogenase component 1 [Clostridium fermenticellae]AYD39672.1 nitrogenase molybdenum-iron protein [Clostridium fermenticellae]